METARPKQTTASLRAMRERSEPIAMVTAYDAAEGRFVEDAGLDVILVGDSLGMVVLGYETTLPVTVEDMVHHAKAVRRGAKNTMMLVDMPFLSYRLSLADTLKNAGRIMQESGADGVKLEGGQSILEHVRVLADAGIPVCGHLGLTPQSVLQFGGFKVQGRELPAARRIVEDARRLEDAGAFMVVLECIPSALAEIVTDSVSIPTIGIGAGAGCSGQVLVYHDLLNLSPGRVPRFVKPYGAVGEAVRGALTAYREEVKNRAFPTVPYSYEIARSEIQALRAPAVETAGKADGRVLSDEPPAGEKGRA